MDIVPNPPSNHESTVKSTQIPTDSEAEQDFEESWTNKRQDQGGTSSAAPVTKDKLSHIIIAITTAIDVAEEKMKKQKTNGFGDVKNRLDSLLDVVVNMVLKETNL